MFFFGGGVRYNFYVCHFVWSFSFRFNTMLGTWTIYIVQLPVQFWILGIRSGQVRVFNVHIQSKLL